MQEKSLQNANAIIDRLKVGLGLQTDSQLSQYLGINRSTLSTWRSRNTLDYPLVFAKCKQLNFDWLIKGEGDASADAIDYETLIIEKAYRQVAVTVDASGKENVVLVDVQAAQEYPVRLTESSFFAKMPTVNLPGKNFDKALFRAFEMEGISMMDTIDPNDWVIGKYLDNWLDLQDEQVYIVVTNEQVLIRRCLNRIKDRALLLIKSDNERYTMNQVHVQDIKEIWKVSARIGFMMANRSVDVQTRISSLEEQIVNILSRMTEGHK